MLVIIKAKEVKMMMIIKIITKTPNISKAWITEYSVQVSRDLLWRRQMETTF